jgi:purine-binding chemotaxis protein CheW
MKTADDMHALLVRVAGRICAIPVAHVLETMRPLAIDSLTGLPSWISGVSVIRGAPTPVVSLSALFGETGAPPGRFVVARAGERRIALAVDTVLGVFNLAQDTVGPLPPLVQHAAGDAIGALGSIDKELLLILNSAKMMPDEVWEAAFPSKQ